MNADFAMAEAVAEFTELLHWLISAVLGPRHSAPLGSISAKFAEASESRSLLGVVAPAGLPAAMKAVVELARALLAVSVEPDADDGRFDDADGGGGGRGRMRLSRDVDVGRIQDRVRGAIDAAKGAMHRSAKQTLVELDSLKFAPSGFFWDEAYAREQLVALATSAPARARLEGLVYLCATAQAPHHASKIWVRFSGRDLGHISRAYLVQVDTQPSHVEVLRRLTWFIGSLFMKMPPPPPVATMHSWSLLTPFYSEDILYSAKARGPH